jgi:hypothetical protein
MSRRAWLRALRLWLPVSICLAGVVLFLVTRNENGAEGGALLVSAGLSVWLLNWMYRISVRGDRDRDEEERARRFFDEHGYWPDEAPSRRPRHRKP